MRKTLLTTAKTIIVLAGFISGLFGGSSDSSPPPIVVGIIIAPITILIAPLIIVLLFRVEVAIGFFRPPWESPSCADKMNPLSAVQLGSFVFIAMGVGATISIVWSGLAGLYYALLGLSSGSAFHLALVRLMRRYSLPQANTQNLTLN